MIVRSIKLAGVLLALASPAAVAAHRPPTPRLVVVIAVDQLSAELYQRYRPGFTGGLARLGQGIAFTGYQSHAATETCPGHSTILTGRHPAATGIVANTWIDRRTDAKVYCASVPGADKDMRGPQNLRVGTFGDWLKAARPAARMVSVSGKDRAAIMLGGHDADAVYWWRDGSGFGSSPYATARPRPVPDPAATFDKALFADWATRPPALWPTMTTACATLARPHRFGRLDVSGRVPPDSAEGVETAADFPARADFNNQLHASPLFDAVTLALADDLIDRLRLGRGSATDLLAISLSATDYIGHRYGNGGAEMCVQMAALDAALGRFLTGLDRRGIHYAVVLTADHGGVDAAERGAEAGFPSSRVDPPAFLAALNAAIRATLDLGYDPIELSENDPQTPVIRAGGDDGLRLRVRVAAIAWLKTRPEVVAVTTAEEIAATPLPVGKTPDTLSLRERYRESYDPDRGADLYVQFGEYANLSMPRAINDSVAGHGTPWDHDRRVPILFWWPHIRPALRGDPIETVDIAPTLAAMVGIASPPVDGNCLTQVASACLRPPYRAISKGK